LFSFVGDERPYWAIFQLSSICKENKNIRIADLTLLSLESVTLSLLAGASVSIFLTSLFINTFANERTFATERLGKMTLTDCTNPKRYEIQEL